MAGRPKRRSMRRTQPRSDPSESNYGWRLAVAGGRWSESGEADAGGSNEPETHPNIEEPHEAPGHPEPEPTMDNFTSNLRELIDFLKDNEEVRNAYDRGGLNCKMTNPDIQKDLARCCAEEITEAIMEEIGNRPFSVLIDESRDISVKKQMTVILRYVNSKGIVVERFLALVHVKETTTDALKEALLAVLDRNKLSVSRIWARI
ncbi:uncharacterized protein [Miscanthus floridulus]|uniref:uncharacterized protein isoform X3 n=1 Tax=Miscanthus floridulus TaxID=154761 RepID=UPI00345AFE7F